MLFDAPSAPPSKGWERDDTGGHTRAEPRLSEIPVKRSLLPLGSPFGWSARDRALYVQFLTALLLVVVTLSFVVFDGWPRSDLRTARAPRTRYDDSPSPRLGWSACQASSMSRCSRTFVRIDSRYSSGAFATRSSRRDRARARCSGSSVASQRW